MTWKPGLGSFKVIGNDAIPQIAHNFIFTFYSNFVASLHRFVNIA